MSLKARIQALIRKFGWEVQRLSNANVEQPVIRNVLRFTGVKIALDVGANTGQWGDLILDAGFDGTLVSFEAIPSVHSMLVSHAKSRTANWKVAPCAALGSQRGQIEINVAANLVSSSILPMRSAHVDAAPQSKYIEKQTVDIERLDELAINFLPSDGKILLKVDTQGYEMEVLKGASGLFPRIAAIQLELSLIPLYEGAPTFAEMILFAESKGYELFSIVPGFRDRKTGRLLQVDGFFTRSGLAGINTRV